MSQCSLEIAIKIFFKHKLLELSFKGSMGVEMGCLK